MDDIAREKEEHKNLAQDKQFYSEELKKLSAFMDPEGLSVDKVSKKLREIDDSKFRDVMQDLKFIGDEPEREKISIMERLQAGENAGAGKQQTKLQLKKEVEKLKRAKAELVGELQKKQQLFQQQVDIDK
mmetsp:Transcript_23008/g.35568  ORF Transcript_23008/g.35568 Transcript_23008/m.35568 type:complete len:130 (-) Transcript_23008:1797-2186(-)